MKRIRLAGIIPMEDGFALMHRKDVLKNPDQTEYYVFPGGGQEENETYEEGTLREIKEEFGIDVKIIKKMYDEYSEKFNQTTICYLVKRQDIEKIPLMPPDIKEKFMLDIKNGKL